MGTLRFKAAAASMALRRTGRRGGFAAGVPVTRFGPGVGGPRMPWTGSIYQGDPFLGGLLGGAARLIGGKLLPKAAKWLGKATARTVGGVVSKVGRAVGRVGGHPVGGAAIGTVVGGAVGGMVGGGGGGGGAGARGSYRRMDVGNVRALRRSMRRVKGFAKLARQTIQFTKTTRMKTKRRK